MLLQPQGAVYSAVLSLSPSFIFLPLARVVCIRSELDEALPVSSVFWHCLFWGCTSNHTILPDSFGSASFKAMLSDLGLLELVSMARQDFVMGIRETARGHQFHTRVVGPWTFMLVDNRAITS